MATEGIKKHVAKNGQVSWRVRVELPPDPLTGRRRQAMRSFRTEAEAKVARGTWIAEIDRGIVITPDKVTVGEQFQYWMDTHARHHTNDKTFYEYGLVIRKHILPVLGGIPLQKLSAKHLEAFKGDRLAADVGVRTVELCLMRLDQMLEQAVDLDLIPRNPAKKVKKPRPPKREMQTWTRDQARQFLAAARESRFGPVWVVLLGTGMRRGEALGLRWKDVDFTRGTLTIHQTAGPGAKGRVGTKPKPKTDASRRTIPIDPHILAALREHRDRRPVPLDAGQRANELVFASGLGTPITPSALRRDYLLWVERAGVPRIRIHDQRHTNITLALRAGARLADVSRRAGHARPSITSDIYGHVDEEGMADVAARVSATLFGEDRPAGVTEAPV
jgi:integrase